MTGPWTRRLMWLAVVAVLAAVVVARAQDAGQRPMFQASADAVVVDVAVTKGNTPVSGLAASDFALFDNGVRQDVDVQPVESQPIDVTLVAGAALDQELGQLATSGEAIARLRAMLRPTDRLRVVGIGDSAQELVPMQSANLPIGITAIPKSRGNALDDAVFYALAWPPAPDRRHMVIVFTDGFDTWDSTLSPARLPDVASRSDAVIHVVQFGVVPDGSRRAVVQSSGKGESGGTTWATNSPETTGRWRESAHDLAEAARRTGGAVHTLSSGVDVFQRILDDFRSSYLLRYRPRGVARDGWHAIKVTLTRSGSFTIRAREGYEGEQ